MHPDEKKIQYDKYDKVFFWETIEEKVGDASEIAINRLMLPHNLTAASKEKYEEYLMEHLGEVLLAQARQGLYPRGACDVLARASCPLPHRVDRGRAR